MLRQILDNLLAYSLSQEYVMVQFRVLKQVLLNIKLQQDLKLFKHVDDAMSLYEEMECTLFLISLADAQIPKGLSHQQYAVSSAKLKGDFLSDILNNMQMSLSGMGAGEPKPGSGQGTQLPDIKTREGL
jgi:hypothetical protein